MEEFEGKLSAEGLRFAIVVSCAGLYQVNVRVAADVDPDASAPVVVAVEGSPSLPVTMAVARTDVYSGTVRKDR